MSEPLLIESGGRAVSGRRVDPADSVRRPNAPILIALHGGSYSSAYFDVPGYSLLERAAAAGCVAIGLDRPGYRSSSMPDAGGSVLDRNAAVLDEVVADIWAREQDRAGGIVLVGHSIGSAVTALIAARRPQWPLRGIAVSAIGLSLPPEGPPYEETGDVPERFDVPAEGKRAAMFGPVGGYDDDAPASAALADEPVLYREIVEINTRWAPRAHDVLSRIEVPVHYRQGEHDLAWMRGAEELERVRRAFSSSPHVDAELVHGVGHAIDFHRAGAELHREQVQFAIDAVTGTLRPTPR